MTNKRISLRYAEFDWLGYCISCNVDCCHNVDKTIPKYDCIRPGIKNNYSEIHDNRPIYCQMFPFDIMEFDGKLEWVIKNQCHATPKLDYKEQMDFFERQFSKKLPFEQIIQYVEQDKTSNPQKYVSNDFTRIREVNWKR